MRLRLLVLTSFILLLSSLTLVAQFDDEPRIQEFFALITEDNPIAWFDLYGMDEGETIYVYAESYDLDTFTGICDIDCTSDFFEYNNDIDGRRNRNSAFTYTFDDLEDYTIFVRDCCDGETEGIIRILIGLDAPEVLEGNVFPTGDPFALVYKPTYIDLAEIDYDGDEAQGQQFYGSIDEDQQFVSYELNDIEEGQTVYIYAESDEIDTFVSICDLECDDYLAVADDLDFSAGNLNTGLSYTFEDDGDYRVIVTDCCDEEAEGRFRILIGFNDSAIAKGQFLPNGAQFATEYEPRRSLVQTNIDRTVDEVNDSCEDIELNERPELGRDEETFETENFVIHYTTRGTDRADEGYVDEVAEFVDFVFEVQVNELGWPEPPRDCGEGGDTRYDFYILDIFDEDGTLGFASWDALIGDNPASSIEEEWAAYGHMVIDNDYDGISSPLVVMRATVAHEFHHLIQFGYDVAESGRWMFEATASWIETKTSDDQDVLDYVAAVYNEPNLCIGTREDRAGLRVYGDWLLIDSIAQDFGDDSIITFWETIVEEEGMDAFYRFLEDLDTTPEDVLRRFAIRNLLLDYELGDEFEDTVDVEEFIEDFDTYDSGRDGIEEMAVQYLLIRDSDEYTFELDNDDLTMVVVGINPDDDEVDIYDIGTEGTVDTEPYDYTYIIIMNTNQHDDPGDCNEEDWELEVSNGSRDDFAEPNGEEFDVSNFDPAD